MSVAQRFAGLLQANLDPNLFTRLSVAARQRMRTFDEHLMTLAADALEPAAFDALRSEAERREAADLAKVAGREGRTEADLRRPPAKPTGDEAAPVPAPAQPNPSHAQEMIAERYAVTLTDADQAALVALVRSKGPQVRLLNRSMFVREKYEVLWRGKRIWVVFNPHNSELVTALPINPPVPKKRVGRIERTSRGNPRSCRVNPDEDMHEGDIP